MNLKNKVYILLFLNIFSSCNHKNAESMDHIIVSKNYADIFTEKNQDIPEMIYPMEYYKNKIIEFQKIFPEDCRINSMERVDNIVPGLMCFLVGFDDYNIGRGEGYDIISNAPPRGNFFGLYTFDKNQNPVAEYQVGFKNYLDNIRNILLEKIPGKKFSYGLVLYGDFNNDGINMIASIYLHPPQYEYVFSVFGYDTAENDFAQKLLVPIYIHYEQPYPPVECLENGFKIIEVIDNDYSNLVWNYYLWDSNSGKYIKK